MAALLIAIYHIPGWNGRLYDIGILRNGYLMVPLFFVLSGFVIYKTYSGRLRSTRDLARFQFLRLGRLYPVHLLILMIFLTLETAKFVAARFFNIHSPNSTPFTENNLSAFVQQLFLIQAIGPTGNAETFNGPAWSISVEFYTYLLFGLIVVYLKRAHLGLMALISFASCAVLITERAAGFSLVLWCFTGFFAGCLTAFACVRFSNKAPRHSPSVALLALMLYLMFKPHGIADMLVLPFTALLIFSIVNSADGAMKRMLRARWLSWLGTVSYSIYMVHTVVLWVFIQIHRVLFGRPEMMVAGRSVPQLPILDAGLTYLAAIVFILAAGALTFRFVEAPFRLKSRQLAFAMLRDSPQAMQKEVV